MRLHPQAFEGKQKTLAFVAGAQYVRRSVERQKMDMGP